MCSFDSLHLLYVVSVCILAIDCNFHFYCKTKLKADSADSFCIELDAIHVNFLDCLFVLPVLFVLLLSVIAVAERRHPDDCCQRVNWATRFAFLGLPTKAASQSVFIWQPVSGMLFWFCFSINFLFQHLIVNCAPHTHSRSDKLFTMKLSTCNSYGRSGIVLYIPNYVNNL